MNLTSEEEKKVLEFDFKKAGKELKRRGFKQKELANRLKVPVFQVSYLLKGQLWLLEGKNLTFALRFIDLYNTLMAEASEFYSEEERAIYAKALREGDPTLKSIAKAGGFKRPTLSYFNKKGFPYKLQHRDQFNKMLDYIKANKDLKRKVGGRPRKNK